MPRSGGNERIDVISPGEGSDGAGQRDGAVIGSRESAVWRGVALEIYAPVASTGPPARLALTRIATWPFSTRTS